MSIHFLASNAARPMAAFAEPSSESEEAGFDNWLLGAGHAIPLLWLFVFSESDLLEHPANSDPEYSLEQPIQIPCTTVQSAVTRLRARTDLLNAWFGSKSSLEYHVALFTHWLESLSYTYISLDWYELISEEGPHMMSLLRGLLRGIDNKDPACVADLLDISSLDPSVSFITLEDAAKGEFSEAEMHNFFFLLGDGDHHTPPWS
jgi:hypothetical protein